MSTQVFLLLLVVVGIGVHLLARALPLPPEMVQLLKDDGDTDAQADALDEQNDQSRRRRLSQSVIDDDDQFDADCNVDGTPMLDGIDANGNVFGVTDDWLSDPFD